MEVVRIFKSMNWYGLSSGGYVVLGSFTLQGDFAGADAKPVYFREYSTRSLIYARRDFAGGESARAVRFAFRDLETYLNDERVREEHYQKQYQECCSLLRSGALPTRVVRVNLDWLRARLTALRPLRQRCDDIEQAHTHGVVYAVRFGKADLPFLNYLGAMGLRCYTPLGADRIVGKAILPEDDGQWPSGEDFDSQLQDRCLERMRMGLIAALAVADRDGRTYQAREGNRLPQHTCEESLDGAAGEDESYSLALKHGTPEVVEYVHSQMQR